VKGIRGVINGYYRTGTSIVWWILQQSNPETIILYEPHSIGLHNEFKTLNPKADTVNPLHGMPIYKPYFMVSEEVRRKFLETAKPKPVYTKDDFEDAIRTVEMFNNIDKRVVVQSNQLHPILHEFAKYFDCNYIHIVRDPAGVLYSYTGSPSKLKRRIQRLLVTHAPNYMISKWMNHGKTGKFELKYMMEVAKKLGYINSGGDLLEKFVRMYVNYNYHVLENLDRKRGTIVKFEDLVRNPKFFNGIFWTYLWLKVEPKYNKLDPKRAFQAPEKLKNAIKRRLDPETKKKLDELGYDYQ